MAKNMFERAVRNRLRFQTPFGVLSVEDIWDLTPEQVDKVYSGLAREKKEASEESLINPSRTNTALNLRIEIVRYVFETLQAEKEERENRARAREKDQKILEILERKEDQELLDKSPEELREMLSRNE